MTMGELNQQTSQESSSSKNASYNNTNNNNNTGNHTNQKKKRTAGVADYFTILGVGDDLLWKHTQKQREQQQQLLEQQQLQQEQQQQGDASSPEAKDASQQQQQQPTLDPNQEDQAALMERFYREIIDITILTHQERNIPLYQQQQQNLSQSNHAPSSVTPASSSSIVLLGSAPSYDTTDMNNSNSAVMMVDNNGTGNTTSHSSLMQQHPGILPSPSSHSEATTAATTAVLSETTTTQQGGGTKYNAVAQLSPPAEVDGFTIIARTNPPQRNPSPMDTTNNSSSHQQQQASSHPPLDNPLSTSSFSQPGTVGGGVLVDNIPSNHNHGQTSFPWDLPPGYRPRYGQNNNQDKSKYTFDANLDSSGGGLRDQICSTVLQWEEATSRDNHPHHQQHYPSSSGASVGGSSVSGGGAPLKGLRQKVESSWKRWNPTNNNGQLPHNNNGRAPHQRRSNTKFYLGYKRRSPDQDHAPAIADIQLLYVRLPRQATTTPPSQQAAVSSLTRSQLLNHHHTTPVSPPGSSASGLAGRVAAAAGSVLFRSHGETDSAISSSSHNKEGSGTVHSGKPTIQDYQKVHLEAVLTLPEGFDEWSIPEAFQVVYIPKQQQQPQPALLKQSPVKSNTRKNDTLRQKTVLVASPSHGQRRRQRPHSPASYANHPMDNNHDPHRPPSEVLSASSSAAEEAVEAYVAASFSAPNSPTAPEEDAPAVNSSALKDGPYTSLHPPAATAALNLDAEAVTSFVPKVFTDVPWEEDHQEAGQHHHHPYYHPEERWWYVPVLAVRKQKTGEDERFHEDPGIVDVSVSFCDRAGVAVLPQEQDDLSDDMMVDDNDEEFSLLSKSSWLVISNGDNSTLQKNESKFGIIIGAGQVRQATTNNSPKCVRKTLGSPTILVKRNLPIGFADIAFATRVMDRFPLKNYKGLPLPEEELPMFCYPTGCRLHRAPFTDAPLPEYYGFVVKNEQGDSIFVSCVSFFEPLTRLKIEQLTNMSEKRKRTSLAHRRYCEKRDRRKEKQINRLYCSDDAEPVAAGCIPGGEDDDESDNYILTGFDTMTTFENKTICLVSRHPFWTGFRRFLSHLHILSSSSSDLPLERYISHLLLTVPVPTPGGSNVIVPLPALNEPMVLSLPPLKDFPMVDLPYHRLVACLDIPTIVTLVVSFLAQERKVSFCCYLGLPLY